MRITGGDKLRAQLRRMPKEVRAEVTKAIKASADEAERVAKALVPVDSGALRDSIQTRVGVTDDGVAAVVAAGGSQDEIVKARAVEFGREDTAAQPFIRPAQAFVGKKHKSRVKRAINKGIKAAIGGAGNG